MAAGRVGRSGRKPSGDAPRASAKLPVAWRFSAGVGVDRATDQFGHRDVLALRSATKGVGLFIRELDLRPDHDIMMT